MLVLDFPYGDTLRIYKLKSIRALYVARFDGQALGITTHVIPAKHCCYTADLTAYFDLNVILAQADDSRLIKLALKDRFGTVKDRCDNSSTYYHCIRRIWRLGEDKKTLIIALPARIEGVLSLAYRIPYHETVLQLSARYYLILKHLLVPKSALMIGRFIAALHLKNTYIAEKEILARFDATPCVNLLA